MNKLWIKSAGIRALRTMAQTAAATIGTCMAMSKVDWLMVASSSGLAGVLSILSSITGLPEAGAPTGEAPGIVLPGIGGLAMAEPAARETGGSADGGLTQAEDETNGAKADESGTNT